MIHETSLIIKCINCYKNAFNQYLRCRKTACFTIVLLMYFLVLEIWIYLIWTLRNVNDKSRVIARNAGGASYLSEESRLLLEDEGRVRNLLFGTGDSSKNIGKKGRPFWPNPLPPLLLLPRFYAAIVVPFPPSPVPLILSILRSALRRSNWRRPPPPPPQSLLTGWRPLSVLVQV